MKEIKKNFECKWSQFDVVRDFVCAIPGCAMCAIAILFEFSLRFFLLGIYSASDANNTVFNNILVVARPNKTPKTSFQLVFAGLLSI